MLTFLFVILVLLAGLYFLWKFVPAWRNAGIKEKVNFIEEVQETAETIKDVSVEKFQEAKSTIEKIKNI